MTPWSTVNKAAPGVPFYTPAQEPAPGSAVDASSDVPSLFRPIKVRGLEQHNRVVVSPMCQYSAHDGHLTDYHLVHLGQLALHGAGLVFVEATAVEPRGRISPEDSGLWADSQVAPLKRIVDFVHSQNGKIGIQIGHAGRKASTLAPWLGGTADKTLADAAANGWPDDVVAVSPIPFAEDHAAPKELTVAEIKGLVKAFADTARRAVEAGFDTIEIHAAHGYLLSSSLSPLSNQRTDEYGGSFENRTRLLKEVIGAVRGVIPETMPLWVRVSGTEWMESTGAPSWDLESTIRLAKELPALGVDVLDVSSGGNSAAQQIPKDSKRFQSDLARAVRKAVEADGLPLLVGTVGYIEDGGTAAELVQEGAEARAGDFALLGRQFLREPEWVLRAAHGLKVTAKWPNQYHRAGPRATFDRPF
ncbi:NADPH dehydrogenase [Cordyceps fumosorosea ARSEF 2679]|uniref:NADPH dehydrogenase n=1 Tax=Cordyceps fumosorosea (strain ARSEF 2679) TaxID=1081104 RepID=A0A167XIB3_CORFA|nr:NADPH dehydrogenase [Cordyceps fumosorosea ARSEF 2679]OAA65007.1 NADPH dehydrogenase [Cordyceps fumosorosea ARSEF 2679]